MCGPVLFAPIEVGEVVISEPFFFALEKLYKDDHAKGEQQDKHFEGHLKPNDDIFIALSF